MEVIANAMVGSLGHDAATACAAARAGLVRATDLPFTVLDANRDPEPASGHTVPILTGGFEGEPRLVRLLEGALRDLASQLPAELLASARLGFYLSLPARDREREGLARLDDETRAAYLEQLKLATPDPQRVSERARGARIVKSAMHAAELPGRPTCFSVAVSGHCGVMQLCGVAQEDLDHDRVDLALLCGVDSLVGADTLAWLDATRRLRSGEVPVGLAPGEAAGVSVAISSLYRRHLELPSQGRIQWSCRGSSAAPFFAGEGADGQGQAQAQLLEEVIQASRLGPTGQWFIVDQNGEEFRAQDFGRALLRLRARSLSDGDPTLCYPAASFGDLGAAYGAIAICMALRAHDRGYAPSPAAIVVAHADGPQRAACLVSSEVADG